MITLYGRYSGLPCSRISYLNLKGINKIRTQYIKIVKRVVHIRLNVNLDRLEYIHIYIEEYEKKKKKNIGKYNIYDSFLE